MNGRKILFWVTLFSIAMGFLEAAIVIYLRKIYYPHGFSFPLMPIDRALIVVEVCREAATIIMLLAVGVLAGKNSAERFGYFLFSFAVWDFFYYVFLKIFINWPPSFFTWDILFLIPVAWIGPVLAPIIIDVTMVLFTVTIISFSGKKIHVRFKGMEKLLLLLGALVAIVSFTEDYVRNVGPVILKNYHSVGALFNPVSSYVPDFFNWTLFLFGEVIILISYTLYYRRLRKMIS